MRRMLRGATLALLLFACSPSPAVLAGGAIIETTAPLADRSEESIKAAVLVAIDKAVRGAAAMGFAWFELRDAQITGDEVAIQILATDEGPESSEKAPPAPAPEPLGNDPPSQGEDSGPAPPRATI